MGLFDWTRRTARKHKAAQQDAATIRARPSQEAIAPQPAPSYATELVEIHAELDFLRTRLATYLGDGIALTYLVDETPIFVNANDIGGPFNLINGGRYEEQNTQVLLSFLRPDSVFLDIGANIGYFSIVAGRRLGRAGKIYAFEPHPKLYEILTRNGYVNNLTDKLSCLGSAISNQDGTATLQYPALHLGGGHIGSAGDIAGHSAISTETRKLDTLFGPDFHCDLVKIDVEGHELSVLEGMRTIVENSPDIKILFEKLVVNAGSENELQTYFRSAGFNLYAVCADASLTLLEDGALAPWSGYVLATRPGAMRDGLKRARFSIYGAQLWSPTGPANEAGPYIRAGNKDDLLFHGPYWFLPSGIWRLKFHGTLSGTLRFEILHRFGHRVLEFPFSEGQTEHVLVVPRALVHFECAAYAASPVADVNIERLEFILEG